MLQRYDEASKMQNNFYLFRPRVSLGIRQSYTKGTVLFVLYLVYINFAPINMNTVILHRYRQTSYIDREMMNCPFYVDSSLAEDPLVREAVEQTKAMVAAHEEWQDEVMQGKMFGILAVKDEEGRLGFLTAYSGQIGGREDWERFVPAVFDYLQPDGYFCKNEQEISDINHRINALLHDEAYLKARIQLQEKERRNAEEVSAFQERMRQAKRQRDERRATATSKELEAMIRESQWMKAELRRIKQRQRAEKASMEQFVSETENEVAQLRKERKRRSDELQRWLFSRFMMRNVRDEQRNLLDIFADTPQGIPPSGAGECCAPKLLQYAFLHHMQPLRIAEFWLGASPVGEIRHEGHLYPACRGKCLPILSFMLQGLDVAPNPLEQPSQQTLDIIYEDRLFVVVNKPAGMLAVPGKTDRESVYSILRSRYPEVEGPMIVHRLDMATSGLMIVAKTTWAYHQLQRQFEQRSVKKRYIALLAGDISHRTAEHGTISLPLCADINDRPRQIVDREHGREAVTDYEVLGTENGHTRIALYPHTGRTHQLRVHCAHPDGLNSPILGDALYGTPSDRLYLHAQSLTFTHPTTGEEMVLKAPPHPPLSEEKNNCFDDTMQ